MRPRTGNFAAYASVALIAAAALAPKDLAPRYVASPHQAASAPRPSPAALAGHPFVSQVTPAAMASPRWDEPRNAPGRCAANPRQVHRNAHGYAELDTTGATGNCTRLQS